jgi:TAT (twin-arginine translocation) pathway signal sequence
MSELNRRAFLRTSAGVAAAGAVAGALSTNGLATASPSLKVPQTLGTESFPVAEAKAAPVPDPLVAYVRNRAKGEVVVQAGSGETVIIDKSLVRHLERAAAAVRQG